MHKYDIVCLQLTLTVFSSFFFFCKNVSLKICPVNINICSFLVDISCCDHFLNNIYSNFIYWTMKHVNTKLMCNACKKVNPCVLTINQSKRSQRCAIHFILYTMKSLNWSYIMQLQPGMEKDLFYMNTLSKNVHYIQCQCTSSYYIIFAHTLYPTWKLNSQGWKEDQIKWK